MPIAPGASLQEFLTLVDHLVAWDPTGHGDLIGLGDLTDRIGLGDLTDRIGLGDLIDRIGHVDLGRANYCAIGGPRLYFAGGLTMTAAGTAPLRRRRRLVT